jgi:cation transport ATPase
LRLGELISWICATPIQFVISAKLYESAVKSLVYARKANVDTLVMLSSSAAYVYSLASAIVSLAKKQHEGTKKYKNEMKKSREKEEGNAGKANVDTLVMLSSSAAYVYSLASVIVSLAKKQHEGTKKYKNEMKIKSGEGRE